ncbi:hypothetical protein BJ508DRAFT_419475 [Ascobolus immersus RN42]|uniref:Uncharacterized protein n=1 Tax=Ascobolus immersus RN42 TaxID=1160509 RepID=A0A3N4HDW0_ASCIM|nr:hypothetical protein BJ508DRAFT_419475 [Ascobolus immersus RN42]
MDADGCSVLTGRISDSADLFPPAKRRRFTEPESPKLSFPSPSPQRTFFNPDTIHSPFATNRQTESLKRTREHSPEGLQWRRERATCTNPTNFVSTNSHAGFSDTLDDEPRTAAVDHAQLTNTAEEARFETERAESNLVCYGVIGDIELETARKIHVRSFGDTMAKGRFRKLKAFVDQTYGYISIHLSNGKFLGMLECRIKSAVGAISKTVPLCIEAFLDIEDQQVEKQKLKILVTLNGSHADTTAVADVLYGYDLFLEKPDPEISNLPYKNPQELEIPSELLEQFRSMELARPSTVLRKVEVKDMLSELWKSDRGPLRLETCRFTEHIETPLLPHQIEALSFLRAREEESNASERSFNYMSSSLGGLLADDMGLGKSLTALALVASTVPQSITADDSSSRLPTLIVVTTSTLSLWEDELSRHLRPDRLRSLTYHGPRRKSRSKMFHQHDIVLTTYDIVVQDWSSKTLHNIEWLRVILDEAHLIRNHTTKRSKAVSALLTNRRWALTGTPIQNRLSDLGGILHFLKLHPYPSFASFSQNILKHLKNGDNSRLKLVHDLLQSIALRRTKNVLKDLPSREDFIEELEFSEEERKVYEICKRESIRRIDSVLDSNGSDPGGISRVAGPKIMHCILIQRQVCCHSTALLPPDIRARLHSAQAEELLRPISEDSETLSVECESCNVKFEPKEGNSFEFCFHLICDTCTGSLQTKSCPVCIPEEALEETKKTKCKRRESDEEWFTGIGYEGPSTKVLALVRNLEAAVAEDPPVKSVIFSCWTRMLFLIGYHLEKVGIKYLRIDGSMSIKDRTAVLDEFKSGSERLVLLMSIGTGCVGLNLSAASHVHLMEPQWNPMVESQALDRVYRLGQTRPVKTIRYIVKDTFEKNMLELQEKKLLQITLTLDAPRAEAMRGRLMDLKRIFS